MNVLEEILEELFSKFRVVKNDEDLEWNRAIDKCHEIIRSHMDEAPDSVEEKSILCTLNKNGVLIPYDDTYDVVIHCSTKENQEQTVKLIKDSNWIPIEERLPETDDYILISFDNASIVDI